ncbi:BON domain-containing protein [Fluviicola taffensis]|uniref:BON domain-containing protein n=1 Tax=Fluviicola taffensis TaxID=191579 RepID=UPI003138148C
MKTDEEIQKHVMEELKWQPSIRSTEIGVAVKNGVVTLTGLVDTYLEKKIAEKAAFKVEGVKAVAEDIEINIGFNHKKTDSEIAQAALDALKWNVMVPEDKIKVRVENGWLTTEGMVEWAYEQHAVRDAMATITGIKGVSNLVKISPKVNPEDVKKKILAAFERSATIDANNIHIENIGSKVTLTGIVRSYAERRDAESAAWNAPGVTMVENNLNVELTGLQV